MELSPLWMLAVPVVVYGVAAVVIGIVAICCALFCRPSDENMYSVPPSLPKPPPSDF